jgi:hypothetical protein
LDDLTIDYFSILYDDNIEEIISYIEYIVARNINKRFLRIADNLESKNSKILIVTRNHLIKYITNQLPNKFDIILNNNLQTFTKSDTIVGDMIFGNVFYDSPYGKLDIEYINKCAFWGQSFNPCIKHKNNIIPDINTIKYRIMNHPICKNNSSYYEKCLSLTINLYIDLLKNQECSDYIIESFFNKSLLQ